MKEITIKIIKIILFILPYIIILILLFTNLLDKKPINIFEQKTLHSQCISDSMGLIIDCRNELRAEDIKNKNFNIGDIYIYRLSENNTVIHRLVYDCRQGCFGLIFKGDNNYGADQPVNETQILYRVTGIEYK